MGLELSETQIEYPKPITAPQAGYQFMQPWFEDYQRRLGASVFGAPGQYGGLMDQPQPIPLEGTAGMTPLMMMARQGVMGVGPYEPAYRTAAQMMGEAAGGYRGSTGAFDPSTMMEKDKQKANAASSGRLQASGDKDSREHRKLQWAIMVGVCLCSVALPAD
jgi:hypothetical protein